MFLFVYRGQESLGLPSISSPCSSGETLYSVNSKRNFLIQHSHVISSIYAITEMFTWNSKMTYVYLCSFTKLQDVDIHCGHVCFCEIIDDSSKPLLLNFG